MGGFDAQIVATSKAQVFITFDDSYLRITLLNGCCFISFGGIIYHNHFQ